MLRRGRCNGDPIETKGCRSRTLGRQLVGQPCRSRRKTVGRANVTPARRIGCVGSRLSEADLGAHAPRGAAGRGGHTHGRMCARRKARGSLIARNAQPLFQHDTLRATRDFRQIRETRQPPRFRGRFHVPSIQHTALHKRPRTKNSSSFPLRNKHCSARIAPLAG